MKDLFSGDGATTRQVKLKINSRPKKRAKQRSSAFSGFTDYDWRGGVYWTIAMWILFAFLASAAGIWQVASYLGIPAEVRFALMLAVSCSEGIVISWALAPRSGTITKAQEQILRSGSMHIIALQVVEIILSYSAQLTQNETMYIAAFTATVVMLARAAYAAKECMELDEERLMSMEEADVRIEHNTNMCRIKQMRSRQILDEQRDIIQTENDARIKQSKYVKGVLEMPESEEAIEEIAIARAHAVIQKLKENSREYTARIMGKAKQRPAAKP